MALVGTVLPPLPARRRPAVRLWLPLTPLWIVLAPLALVLAPLILLVPACRHMRPYRTALSLGAVLLSLSGTDVEVDAHHTLVRIRIF